jgi:hypothetical protein
MVLVLEIISLEVTPIVHGIYNMKHCQKHQFELTPFSYLMSDLTQSSQQTQRLQSK